MIVTQYNRTGDAACITFALPLAVRLTAPTSTGVVSLPLRERVLSVGRFLPYP